MCNFVDKISLHPESRSVDFTSFLKVIGLNSFNKQRILLFSNVNDINSNVLGIYLLKNDINYIRINQEDFSNNFKTVLSISDKDSSSKFQISGDEFSDDNVPLIFHREFNLQNHLFSTNGFVNKFISEEWNNFLITLNRKLSCPWINSLESSNISADRFRVFQLAVQFGFKIPDTIITNDGEEVKKFYIKHNKQLVVKVVSHHNINSVGKTYSIYTHHFTDEDLQLLESLRFSPCIFQKRINHNKEVRVTITRSEIFATELDLTDKYAPVTDIHRLGVDYIKKKAISLSNEYEKKCINLISSLGLDYGTIDLLVGLDNQYYFLEVNSSGDWYWIEKETAQPITQSIINTIKTRIKN